MTENEIKVALIEKLGALKFIGGPDIRHRSDP